jgi:nucleoid DNA-binding protein
VTKKDIVRWVSDRSELPQHSVKDIVHKTFEAIVDVLAKEGRLELRNFGVFQIKPRAARKARNPRTGRQVEVPERFVVVFKPGREMEQRTFEIEGTALAEQLRAEADNNPDWESHEPVEQTGVSTSLGGP